MTAVPFMASAKKGGSATKTSTGRTFVLAEPQSLLIQVNCNIQRLDPISTMDFHDRSKYTPTRTDPINRILLTIIVATAVVLHNNIPLLINTIKIALTITTTNSGQLNVLILKKKMNNWTTYPKV